eukprot:9059425-Pyramimonas_sp.AAC.1
MATFTWSRHSFRYTPQAFRGHTRSSTKGPSGAARMQCCYPLRYTPQPCRGRTRSSTEGPTGAARMLLSPPVSAHPSYIAWPQREPHR